jgi:hypothetical protein
MTGCVLYFKQQSDCLQFMRWLTAIAPEQENQPPAAPVEEDDETIARRLAIIFHGDDVEWKGFLTKAHHWMSLSIDAADKRAQAHECSSADTGDVKFSFAWELNEVLCEVIEGGADESRVISAKVAAHPKMKKWLDVAPRLPTEPQGAGK